MATLAEGCLLLRGATTRPASAGILGADTFIMMYGFEIDEKIHSQLRICGAADGVDTIDARPAWNSLV